MKKNFIFLLLFALFNNSCNQQDEQIIKDSLADAAAAAAYIAEYAYLLEIPIIGEGIVLGGAAVVAAEASGLFAFNEEIEHEDIGLGRCNSQHIFLPQQFILQSNNLESLGRNHNVALNYMKENNFIEFSNQLMNYNLDKWTEILQVIDPNLSNDDCIAIVSYLQNENIYSQATEYLNISTNYSVAELTNLIDVNQETKDYLGNVSEQYMALKSASASVKDVSSFINEELIKLDGTDDVSSKELLVKRAFLSTLKHSNYIWD